MEKAFESYFGGKEGSGTYQQIINHIRPHDRYVEAFLGNGAIMRKLEPCRIRIGSDLSQDVIERWRALNLGIELHQGDGISLAKGLSFDPHIRTVIYFDPPYPLLSRKSDKEVYEYEMTDQQHEELLDVATQLPCDVLLSTYPNEMYEKALKGWYRHEFYSATRHGMALEYLYMNYPKPDILHDYRYLGEDYRERERIKKKITREVKKLQRLPAQERNAIIQAILSNMNHK